MRHQIYSILKCLPLIIIIVGTTISFNWKQHPYSYTMHRIDNWEKLSLSVLLYQKKFTKDKSNYFLYQLPVKLQNEIGEKELVVRYSKNEFSHISELDYDCQKFIWNLGKVEYRKGKHWYRLHSKLSNNEDLLVPITVQNFDEMKLEESLFLRVLPAKWRKDSKGELTKIIINKKLS